MNERSFIVKHPSMEAGEKWGMRLTAATGKQAPNPKIQTTKKHQFPSSNSALPFQRFNAFNPFNLPATHAAWLLDIGDSDSVPGQRMHNLKLKLMFPDLRPSRRYLVGVSGGHDSVALLHWLHQNEFRKLTVCHLNHQLRGRSSLADARFVEKLSANYNLEFECNSADVRAFAAKEKMSIETAARQLRYSFFAATAKRRRTTAIFLGHHADDLVETMLLNLFRGSGLAGLAGMREMSERRVDNVNLTIIRPLLRVWRSEIDNYVRVSRLRFREDRSNRELTPMRNRLRKKVIPYLEKTLGRDIRRNLWRTAVIVAEEEKWFESLLRKKLYQPSILDARLLSRIEPALQRRLLRKWLQRARVADVGFDLIERVRSLLDPGNRVAKTNLPRNRHVRRRAGKLFLE